MTGIRRGDRLHSSLPRREAPWTSPPNAHIFASASSNSTVVRRLRRHGRRSAFDQSFRSERCCRPVKSSGAKSFGRAVAVGDVRRLRGRIEQCRSEAARALTTPPKPTVCQTLPRRGYRSRPSHRRRQIGPKMGLKPNGACGVRSPVAGGSRLRVGGVHVRLVAGGWAVAGRGLAGRVLCPAGGIGKPAGRIGCSAVSFARRAALENLTECEPDSFVDHVTDGDITSRRLPARSPHRPRRVTSSPSSDFRLAES